MNRLVALGATFSVALSSSLAFAQPAPAAPGQAPGISPPGQAPGVAPAAQRAPNPVAPPAGPRPTPANPPAVPNAGAPATGVAPATPTAADQGVFGGMTTRDLPDRAPPDVEGVTPEPGGLTAAEVSRRAISVRPSLAQKRAELRAANDKITQTMIQFFPKLTVSAGYTRLSPVTSSFGGAIVGAQNAGPLSVGACPGGAGQCVLDSGGTPIAAQAFTIPTVVDNWSVTGRLSIPLSDYLLRVADASASSRAGSDAAKISLAAEKYKVDVDSRSLYYNWLRARAQASIAKKSVEQTHARLDDARASFAVGAISKADLLSVEALVANTELVQSQAEAASLLTTGQLAVVMEDWHPNYHVGEGIPLPSSVPPEPRPVSELIAEAHSRRLELRAVQESVKAYRRGGDATRAGAYPRVDAVGDVTYANPNQRYFPPTKEWHTTWSVGVLASWTVGDTFLNTAAANELEENAIAAEAKVREVRAGIALEVMNAWTMLGNARVSYEKRGTALAAAEEAYRVRTDLFKAGRATGTELIDAENQLLQAKFGEVNARIDLTLASLALRHALGRDVPPDAVKTAENEAKR